MKILSLAVSCLCFWMLNAGGGCDGNRNVDDSGSSAKTEVAKDCIDQSKINKDAICTMDYNPVCGCDEKTYSNACVAENNGVTSWRGGECGKPEANDCIDSSKINKDAICTMDYNPVCGCDEKTYSNVCVAVNAGVLNWKEGECASDTPSDTGKKGCIDKSKIKPDKPCTKELRPVCGCDGKTYPNKCLADKAGLTRWVNGPCGK